MHPGREEAVGDAELAGSCAQRGDAVTIPDEHGLHVGREAGERLHQLPPVGGARDRAPHDRADDADGDLSLAQPEQAASGIGSPRREARDVHALGDDVRAAADAVLGEHLDEPLAADEQAVGPAPGRGLGQAALEHPPARGAPCPQDVGGDVAGLDRHRDAPSSQHERRAQLARIAVVGNHDIRLATTGQACEQGSLGPRPGRPVHDVDVEVVGGVAGDRMSATGHQAVAP